MQRKVILFNPAIGTLNEGDKVIYDAVKRQVMQLLPYSMYFELPTQMPVSKRVLKWYQSVDYRFICGTNLLQSSMLFRKGRFLPHIVGTRQWDLNLGCIHMYYPSILIGCGWKEYQKKVDSLSCKVWHSILSDSILHSVRDSYTQEKLHEMGFDNVLNTGCATMWGFTRDFCESIPQDKAENVITTITDYRPDQCYDQKVLKVLSDNYHRVFLWLQGYDDEEYTKTLQVPNNVSIIYGGIETYNSFLESNQSIDYVGTRLHGGIRALQKKKRTIFIAVDNRTREMGKNFGLNWIERTQVNDLADYINSARPCTITLPLQNIQLFKDQFRSNQR